MGKSSNRIAAVRQNFLAMQGRLSCPLCRQPLKLAENSLRCANGHCYDLSAHNYLNLAPQKNQTGNKYTAELFEARRAIFNAGFYEPLLQKIEAICREHLRADCQSAPLLLDAGCGEGFFAASLRQIDSLQVCALDLAKDAVQLAAKGPVQPGLYWLIADLAKLPLLDASVDIILNLLSPANYQEFARVLKPGGLLIKVLPGPSYLREVRQALQIPAPAPRKVEQQAVDIWQQNISPLQTQVFSLTYQKAVEPAQAAAFMQMSPLSFNHKPALAQADFAEITIDLRILAAKI